MFEILEHTADVGFRARGRTLPELFAESARALVSIAIEPEGVRPLTSYPVNAVGEDIGSVLVNFLNEVLYLLDGARVAIEQVDVAHAGITRVEAQAWGEPRDATRHPAKVVVKGVTYHQLKIGEDRGGWYAEVYLDV